ncbi:uncharacterized protein LOC133303021 [Gastrolobium bilobum]|uniref:uncharacterized protein LOC133303021 n=1 Tax=Gastrolobium bilobum TaxID=150636 RepID=UPI002AB273D4|nr:uncharacterized protein LOC133303021 [Gastrolobium bilobum]
MKTVLVSFIYASPRRVERRHLWQNLQSLIPNPNVPWVAIGDFNSVANGSAKLGGAEVCLGSAQEMLQCLQACELNDIGFQVPCFTWKRGRLQERLDMACTNEKWNIKWPNTFLAHFPFFNSDHRLIIMMDNHPGRQASSQKPFRFMEAWLTSNNFSHLANEAWTNNRCWAQDSSPPKSRIDARLKGIDHNLSFQYNSNLVNLRKSFWKDLETILLREELTWFQRSRSRWIKYGDRNTRYFHANTVAKRRRNIIDALKNDDGEWVSNVDQLTTLASTFFMNLYTEDNTSRAKLPLRGMFPSVHGMNHSGMNRVPFTEEIRRLVFKMGKFKAPGPDGLLAVFFQSQWDNIGASIGLLIKELFLNPQ